MAWRVTDGLDGELEDPYADDPKGTQRMGSFAYAKFETDFSLPPPPRTRWDGTFWGPDGPPNLRDYAPNLDGLRDYAPSLDGLRDRAPSLGGVRAPSLDGLLPTNLPSWQRHQPGRPIPPQPRARATEDALEAAMVHLTVLMESIRAGGPGQAVMLRAKSEQLRAAAEMLERGEVDEATKLLAELEEDFVISGLNLHHEIDDPAAVQVVVDPDRLAQARARVVNPSTGERPQATQLGDQIKRLRHMMATRRAELAHNPSGSRMDAHKLRNQTCAARGSTGEVARPAAAFGPGHNTPPCQSPRQRARRRATAPSATAA